MPDYRKMFDSEYLANWDLEDDTTVEISKVVAGEVGGQHGETKSKRPVIYFKSARKGMVLNKTNGKIIAGMYGNLTEKWIGKSITLFVTQCEAFGETVDCIRVRPTVPKREEVA